MEEVQMLSVREVAKMLNCHPDTARKIMKRKDFPLVKIGNRLEVEKQALIHYIRKEEFKEKI